MKKMSVHVLTAALAMTMVFAAGTAVNPQSASAKKVKVKKVTAVAPSGKTAYVAKGKKVKITTTVKVKPNKKANKKVTYKSANKKIATVSSKGVIKAKKAGKTKITITSKKNKKKKTTMKVVVKKKAVKSLKLNSGNFVLSPGAKKTLKATVSPSKNVSKKLAWTTSNKRVATVSSKGVVKAVKAGKATITVKATDGSNKKKKVQVTVGTGIAGVGITSASVPTPNVVRVVLSGAKTLASNDFVIQTRSGASSTKYRTVPVSQVSTTDHKVYDVNLEGDIAERTYVKVTIGALSTNKSIEIYVDCIPEYGDAGNEEVVYVDKYDDEIYLKGDFYNGYWDIYNSNAVGAITYTSVTGLPSGLNAYISKDKSAVRVIGVFNGVENGTTATLTGVDEKGTTFTRKYIFYVGDADHLVVGAEPAYTDLSYIPDDPKTDKDEESGYFIDSNKVSNFLHISGGSGYYQCKYTCNGKDLSELTQDSEGNYIATPAGTYNIAVEITDEENENLKQNAMVTINLVNGVTVSGMVRDAAGQPAKWIGVNGSTKHDVYGRNYELSATTEKDGTYSVRVVPGDYYTCCYYYGNYDTTVGNNFTQNTTKNFTLPLYNVRFALNVPGAAAYGNSYNISIIDSYGELTYLGDVSDSSTGDFSMFAYLRAGSYSVAPSKDSSSSNTVYVYSKVNETTIDGKKNYEIDYDSFLGNYKATGSFTVSGNGTVTLNATKFEE